MFEIMNGNQAGLDAPSLALLAEDFAPLDSMAPNLASRVMRYLLDGTDDGILAELAALPQSAQKLRLRVVAPFAPTDAECARSRFFQSTPSRAPQFFVRLGRVYEAAARRLRIPMVRVFGGPGLDWLQLLLIEAAQPAPASLPRSCRPCAVLTADLIEAMLEADGHPRDLLARAAFLQPGADASRFALDMEPVWEGIPGLGGSIGRHPAAALDALSQPHVKQQLRALNLMKKYQAPPAGFFGKLFELARVRSRKVRARAGLLLAEAWPLTQPLLREKAACGKSAERVCAARILWRAEVENARVFLAARVPRKRSGKVARTLQELLAAPPPLADNRAGGSTLQSQDVASALRADNRAGGSTLQLN
jgi:hypothetical protein